MRGRSGVGESHARLVSNVHSAIWRLAFLTALIPLAAVPAQAGRGILVDVNSFEVWGDAGDGNVIPLEFPVNFGAGMQSAVTVNLQNFDANGSANVGLTFASSPSDVLFATVGPQSPFFDQVPAVSLANSSQVSTPTQPVPDASIFNFGVIINADEPPGACAPSDFCSFYGPLADGANFQFVNLASTGQPGDFLLNILCNAYPCENIGFSLAGENFSSATFNPASPPSNLVSYSTGTDGSMWSFVFRNSAALPEPSTWASMILGFGLLGSVLRRQRKLLLKAN